MSRTRVKALIEEGRVRLRDAAVREAAAKLAAGDTIELDLPPPAEATPRPEKIALDVVFEDDQIIVIDKPAGLVVHPAAGNETGTLVNALLAHCGDSLSGIGGVKRPGIVHRLDKDTSGLMVVAKTDIAHQALAALFADHGRTMPFLREYRAFAWGVPSRAAGTVEAAIDRHAIHREKMAVVSPDERGRHAVTHWRLGQVFSARTAHRRRRKSCAGWRRAHAPDSRPSRAYRSSPAGRPDLWRRASDEGDACSSEPARAALAIARPAGAARLDARLSASAHRRAARIRERTAARPCGACAMRSRRDW